MAAAVIFSERQVAVLADRAYLLARLSYEKGLMEDKVEQAEVVEGHAERVRTALGNIEGWARGVLDEVAAA